MTTNAVRTSILALGLLVCTVGLARADEPAPLEVIRLRSGGSIKGMPHPEKSTDGILVIEDAVSGNVRRITWSAIEKRDADRLRVAWGLQAPRLDPITGHRIRIVLDGGMLTEVLGVIVRRTDTHVHVQTYGERIRIEHARVHSTHEMKVDMRDVWTPAQLADMYMRNMPPALRDEDDELTTPARMRCARFAEFVGAYTLARRLYEQVAADEESPLAGHARTRLEGIADTEEQLRATQELRAARQAIRLGSFRKGRQRLDAVRQAHPEPAESLARQIANVQRLYEVRRRAWCIEEVARVVRIRLDRRIEERAWNRKTAFADALAWLRRELAEELLADAQGALSVRTRVTPEETRAFWDQRPRRGWRSAGYGSGSFIVTPVGPRPPRKGRSKEKGVPKPPTRDAWWSQATTTERASWLLAHFVETSGLFDLRAAKHIPCAACTGTGIESTRTQSGRTIRFLCRRCAGLGSDRVVRYR